MSPMYEPQGVSVVDIQANHEVVGFIPFSDSVRPSALSEYRYRASTIGIQQRLVRDASFRSPPLKPSDVADIFTPVSRFDTE